MNFFETITEFFPDDNEIKDFFIHHSQKLILKKNEFISRNGSFNRNIYFIEKGLLRTFYYEDGKDITTNFYLEGKLVANVDTLFDNESTKYNIEALEDSEVIYCNFKMLEDLCEKSLSAANFSRYILSRLLVQTQERVSTLQYMNAKERYENLLKNHPDIILRAPLGGIASYLGISPETLSRIRSGK